ncbi:hypothetical protein Tco_1209516 [Tanacetum coccineum]
MGNSNAIILEANYKTGKEVWDALKTRHVGVNRVQQAKQQTLKSKFEMLQMKENEHRFHCLQRLTVIINKGRQARLAYEDSSTLIKNDMSEAKDADAVISNAETKTSHVLWGACMQVLDDSVEHVVKDVKELSNSTMLW